MCKYDKDDVNVTDSHSLGVTHSSDYHIWQKSEYASNGVREFSEKGEAWTLIKEVEAAGERIQSVYGLFSTPAVLGGTGQTTTEFEVYARHSFVSYVQHDGVQNHPFHL